RAHRESRAALSCDRAQDVEVALDPARLRARGHDATLDVLADVEHGVADRHRRADEIVLAGAVEQDVGTESPAVPVADRGRRNEGDAGARRVVERPFGADEWRPPPLALEVGRVLVAPRDGSLRR